MELGMWPGPIVVRGSQVYIGDIGHDVVRLLNLETGRLSVIAGTGPSNGETFEEGLPARSTDLDGPSRMAFDAAGNLYFSEPQQHRIRKIDTSGIVTTVVGTGTRGFSGDGGPARSAQVDNPGDLLFTPAGELVFSDSYNHRIRKVSPSGTINTIAGRGTMGFSGDLGLAPHAEFSFPHDLALDPAGNLFIGDSTNNRVRKLAPTGIITTVAGNGTMEYAGDGTPATQTGLDGAKPLLDDAGRLYVVGSRRILRFEPLGFLTTVAGTGDYGDYSGEGGPATAATMGGLMSADFDDHGNLFIASNLRILRVDAAGIIRTVAGTGLMTLGGDGGPATDAQFAPDRLAVDRAGNIYGREGHRIRRVDPSGTITAFAGQLEAGFAGDGGPATEAAFHHPEGITADRAGTVYVADKYNQRVRAIDPGGTIRTVAGSGCGGAFVEGVAATSTCVHEPHDVAVDDAGNLYIAVRTHILKVNAEGILTRFAGNGEPDHNADGNNGDGGPATHAPLYHALGVDADGAGNVYLGEWGLSKRLRRVDQAGIITTIFRSHYLVPGGGFPRSTEADATGALYVTDGFLWRIDPSGEVAKIAGREDATLGDGGPAAAARVGVSDIALDAQGNLFIADRMNHRVRKIESLTPVTTTSTSTTTSTTTTQPPSTTTTTVVPPPPSRSLLLAAHSGKAMHAPNIPSLPGGSVVQWAPQAQANQQWRMLRLGGDLYAIASVGTGMVLDVGTSTADGGASFSHPGTAAWASGGASSRSGRTRRCWSQYAAARWLTSPVLPRPTGRRSSSGRGRAVPIRSGSTCACRRKVAVARSVG